MGIIRITNQDKEQQDLINNIKLLAESKDEEMRLKKNNTSRITKDLITFPLEEKDFPVFRKLSKSDLEYMAITEKFKSKNNETFYILGESDNVFSENGYSIEYRSYVVICDAHGNKILPLYNTCIYLDNTWFKTNEDYSQIIFDERSYPLDIDKLKQIQYNEADFIDRNKRFALIIPNDEPAYVNICSVYDSLLEVRINPEKCRILLPKDYYVGAKTKKLSEYSNIANKAKEWVESFIKNEQETLSKVLETYQNSTRENAESRYPLNWSSFDKKFNTAETESNNEEENRLKEYENTLALIDKYCSLSNAARKELNLEKDTLHKLKLISMIRENPKNIKNNGPHM